MCLAGFFIFLGFSGPVLADRLRGGSEGSEVPRLFEEIHKFMACYLGLFLAPLENLISTCMHYILHTLYFTPKTTNYIQHTTHYTIHTKQYTLHITHYKLHAKHYTLQTTHYTLRTTHYTIHTTHYTLNTKH